MKREYFVAFGNLIDFARSVAWLHWYSILLAISPLTMAHVQSCSKVLTRWYLMFMDVLGITSIRVKWHILKIKSPKIWWWWCNVVPLRNNNTFLLCRFFFFIHLFLARFFLYLHLHWIAGSIQKETKKLDKEPQIK